MSTGAAQPASPFEESRAAIPTDPLQPAELLPAELLPAEPALPAGTTREVEAMADGRRITFYRREPVE